MTSLLLSLSVLGFFISLYFTAVAYRWIRPDVPWIPTFCQLGEKTCATIVFTPRARVFGLPNSVLGQVFYVALMAGVAGGFLYSPPAYYAYLMASLVTVCLGLFLTYSLLFVTRVHCTLCFTSHGINFIIFLILVLGRTGSMASISGSG